MTLTQENMRTIYDWYWSNDINLFKNWSQHKSIDFAQFCEKQANLFTDYSQYWGVTTGNGSPAKLNKNSLLRLSEELINLKSDIL